MKKRKELKIGLLEQSVAPTMSALNMEAVNTVISWDITVAPALNHTLVMECIVQLLDLQVAISS